LSQGSQGIIYLRVRGRSPWGAGHPRRSIPWALVTDLETLNYGCEDRYAGDGAAACGQRSGAWRKSNPFHKWRVPGRDNTILKDLIAALKSGRVAAAGLDVFEGEPKLNPGYTGLKNTFLLPHIGSATVESRTLMGMVALDAVLTGKPAPSLVAVQTE